MRVVEDFPRDVEVTEHVWIPMSDGVRLSARIWRPADAVEHPVPAILEYMPYRKRDFTRLRDEPLHHYFAGHGYASIRLDLRGTGDSEGVIRDEYLAQEQDDAVEAIAWIRAQPWCDGAVGMLGLSWAGFNALQVAARRPPGLRAIITMCSTDDRYADDAHYKGGCLLNENLGWGSAFFHVAACPPDPEIVGEDWREQWRQRLEHLVLFPGVWMRHQERDAYWRHGSVCEDYGAVECAVYAVGGWLDGYCNAIPRMMEGLKCPRKALIGPWPHAFPHAAVPGPSIGFFQEAVRWWDYWLKGRATGIMDEPAIRLWQEDYAEPGPYLEERPGRWIAEPQWPSPNVAREVRHLGVGALSAAPLPPDIVHVRSPETTGLKGGDYYGYGSEGEGPGEQREDDGKSLVFDSDPLEEPLSILGAPAAVLELEVDQPVARVIVRLNDVAPDGVSARVSYGVLNLNHRHGHDRPEALEPGERYRVRVPLNDIAYVFPAGHTVRLAVSTAYWPLLWPAPAPVWLSIHTGGSQLELPVRQANPLDAQLQPFAPPEQGPAGEHTALRMVEPQRTVEHDLTTDETVYRVFGDAGDFGGAAVARIEDIDLVVGYTLEKVFRVRADDPLTASAVITQETSLQRDEWRVRIRCSTRLTCDASTFHLTASLHAEECGEVFMERSWDEAIPRRFI